MRRLGRMCSRYQRIQLSQHELTVAAKSPNEQVFANIDIICEAIARKLEISFRYVDYATEDGEKHYRDNGNRYVRSPYHLVYSDGQYYLIAYSSKDRMRQHLRVDRMEDIQVEEGQRRKGNGIMSREAVRDMNKNIFSMFADGEQLTRVTMRFTNNLRGVVYDRFGAAMLSSDEDGKHFTVTRDIAVSQQFYGWLMGLGKQVIVLRPESVRKEYQRRLTEIAAMYDDYRP